MSRGDYYHSANFISDSDAPTVVDDDDLLPGDFGGRGTGLAGGYPSPKPPHPAPFQPTPYPPVAPVDDTYAGYDPGMAGCTSGKTTCAIAGIPYMGHELPRPSRAPSISRDPAHLRHPALPEWVSHGYERDADEYEVEPAPAPVASSSRGPLTDVGNETVQGTCTDPDPDPDPGSGSASPAKEHHADPGCHGKPPIGTRLVGHVERIAGRVLHDPQIKARGTRHVVCLFGMSSSWL